MPNEYKPGHVIAGRYELESRLGKGGMGQVFRAHDRVLYRSVALKTLLISPELPPEEIEEMRKRLMIEARAAARLTHPNIVAIYDVLIHDGTPVLCMELIKGGDLRQVTKGKRQLTFEQCLTLIIQVCQGLHYAHGLQVIHRDIKPANILIDEHGHARITDFGIAKILGADMSTVTRSGAIACTFAYSSPEYLQRGEYSPRSDVFAVGCVLYELLTGRRTFDGEHEPAVWWNIVHHDPAPPSYFEPRLPEALDRAVELALAKEPEARFPSAQHMARALQDILASSSADLAQMLVPCREERPQSSPPPAPAPAAVEEAARKDKDQTTSDSIPFIRLVPDAPAKRSVAITTWLTALMLVVLAAAAGVNFIRLPQMEGARSSAQPAVAEPVPLPPSLLTETDGAAIVPSARPTAALGQQRPTASATAPAPDAANVGQPDSQRQQVAAHKTATVRSARTKRATHTPTSAPTNTPSPLPPPPTAKPTMPARSATQPPDPVATRIAIAGNALAENDLALAEKVAADLAQTFPEDTRVKAFARELADRGPEILRQLYRSDIQTKMDQKKYSEARANIAAARSAVGNENFAKELENQLPPLPVIQPIPVAKLIMNKEAVLTVRVVAACEAKVVFSLSKATGEVIKTYIMTQSKDGMFTIKFPALEFMPGKIYYRFEALDCYGQTRATDLLQTSIEAP